MKRSMFSIATILFLANVSPAPLKSSEQQCQELNKNAVELIRQYKELRERRRLLPEGTFDRDISAWGGKLHRVISALGVELGHQPFTRDLIVKCVGEPDQVWTKEQMVIYLDIYHQNLKAAGRQPQEHKDSEYLVYYWRGAHDFMFFISNQGKIVDHGWWFAYE